jgi:hypothetical protein
VYGIELLILTDTEVTANAFMFIEEGTTLADTAWVLTTNDSITVGGAAGTAMTFTQFAGAGVGISAISIATVNGLQGSLLQVEIVL